MKSWPDEEQLAERFREWLDDAHAEAESQSEHPAPFAEEPDYVPIGLYQVIEEFTALRHEVKLQTKSSRGVQESGERILASLQSAIDAFRSVEAKEEQAGCAVGKPLAEAIVDLDEALDRGREVIELARRRAVEEAPALLRGDFAALFDELPKWRRWLCRAWFEKVRDRCDRCAEFEQDRIFRSLLEGYGLMQNRLARALKEEKIFRVVTAGKPVDPECMTVIEVVEDPDRPPGFVVDELRRGYFWRGKVLRFAEVRAVQGLPSS